MSRPLKTIQAELATALRAAVHAETARDKQAALESCAPLIYEARGDHFTDAYGTPDWRGRAWAYRQWYGDALGAADIPPGDRARLTTAVGYHVANYLRERLDPETLEAIGVSPYTPRQRKQLYDRRRSQLVRGMTGQRTGDGSADGLARLKAIEAILAGGIPLPSDESSDESDELAAIRTLATSLALRLLTVAEPIR